MRIPHHRVGCPMSISCKQCTFFPYKVLASYSVLPQVHASSMGVGDRDGQGYSDFQLSLISCQVGPRCCGTYPSPRYPTLLGHWGRRAAGTPHCEHLRPTAHGLQSPGASACSIYLYLYVVIIIEAERQLQTRPPPPESLTTLEPPPPSCNDPSAKSTYQRTTNALLPVPHRTAPRPPTTTGFSSPSCRVARPSVSAPP